MEGNERRNPKKHQQQSSNFGDWFWWKYQQDFFHEQNKRWKTNVDRISEKILQGNEWINGGGKDDAV